MKFKYFIGIDVSKKSLDVAIRSNQASLFYCQVPNSLDGIRELNRHLKENSVSRQKALFCLEHTGLYNYTLVTWLSKHRLHAWVENPIQIKRSLGLQRGKNDKIDAHRIAEYADRFQDQCRLWQPKREVIQMIEKLAGFRRRLLNAKIQLANPLKEDEQFLTASLMKQIRRSTCKMIKHLEEQIKQVEKSIREIIKQDEQLEHLFSIITSVDGVGEVVFWELVVTTNEFKRINEAKKYACYCGVAPFEHSSGTSVRGKTRVSRMANKSTKRLFHLAAMSSVAMKGELQDYYYRKVSEGKNKMSVINAVRNKLILRIFSCVTENRKYEKNYTYAFV